MPAESYVVGPLVVLVVVGLLALALRWTYGSSKPGQYRPAAHADFGLLREVAVVESIDGANALRALLSDANIRSTSASAPNGVRVLVFAADLDRARQLTGL